MVCTWFYPSNYVLHPIGFNTPPPVPSQLDMAGHGHSMAMAAVSPAYGATTGADPTALESAAVAPSWP